MRRRRNNGTWFPNLGTDMAGTTEWSGRAIFLTAPANGSQTSFSFPLTFDTPIEEPAEVETTLADIVGSEYVLERLVGKVDAEYIPQRALPPALFGINIAAAVRLTVGFFVARADHATPDHPIGADVTTSPGPSPEQNTQDEQYNPASNASIREPWMWRRTWVLSNAILSIEGTDSASAGGNGGGLEGGSYPSNTAQYGSVLDGPHVDIKSVRRIGQDERLYCAASVQLYPVGLVLDTPTLPPTVRLELDYRMLGKLRKSRQHSSF